MTSLAMTSVLSLNFDVASHSAPSRKGHNFVAAIPGFELRFIGSAGIETHKLSLVKMA